MTNTEKEVHTITRTQVLDHDELMAIIIRGCGFKKDAPNIKNTMTVEEVAGGGAYRVTLIQVEDLTYVAAEPLIPPLWSRTA